MALVLAVCLYAVAGGFIFKHLESTNEMEECKQGEAKYQPLENETIYKMWSIASSFRLADDKPVDVCIPPTIRSTRIVEYIDFLTSWG